MIVKTRASLAQKVSEAVKAQPPLFDAGDPRPAARKRGADLSRLADGGDGEGGLLKSPEIRPVPNDPVMPGLVPGIHVLATA